MHIKEFDYKLPKELIAQRPTEKRDASRLMVLNRKKNSIEHKHFYDILDYLKPTDCLVLNNSKVLPARLFGIKEQMYIARDLDPVFMSRCGNRTIDDAATGSVKEYMKHRSKRFDLVTGFHLASSDLNILTNTFCSTSSVSSVFFNILYITPYTSFE